MTRVNAKKTLPLQWRWVMICAIVALVSLYEGDREVGFVFVILTATLAIIAAVTQFIRAIEDVRNAAKKAKDEPEEFTLQCPDPGDHGWHRCTVIPSTKRYEEQICFGGPPTDTSIYEYAIKGDQVFSRLLNLCSHDFDGEHYDVVNGQLMEAELARMSGYETAEMHIERLKRELFWNKRVGALQYFILFQHRQGGSFFTSERERIQKGFEALAEAASKLGATRERGLHRLSENADEETRNAVKRLQSPDGLRRFRIAFVEVRDYEHIMETLDGILKGPAQPAAASSSELH